MDKRQLLAEQMILNIDSCISQLVCLRNEVEGIKNDVTKLHNANSLTSVSTPVPDNGLTSEQIARVLNKREETRRKHHS